MKLIIGLVIILNTVSAFAGTTCINKSKTILSCASKDGNQYDVCKKSNSFQVRVNGEVYAIEAVKSVIDDVLAFQGINYSGERFILEQRGPLQAVLTEVNEYEMPIGEELELTCNL